jgi:hypothetical protein
MVAQLILSTIRFARHDAADMLPSPRRSTVYVRCFRRAAHELTVAAVYYFGLLNVHGRVVDATIIAN